MGDWVLGIDLGTTFTAAAIAGPGRVAEILTLGERSAAIPTLVAVRADGGVVTGDAAARRALIEPDRIVRHVKRRLGDHMPILVGGSPWSPQALLAEVLRAVVERATAEQGVGPRRVAVTHPATWGQYKLDLLRDATRSAEIGRAHV